MPQHSVRSTDRRRPSWAALPGSIPRTLRAALSSNNTNATPCSHHDSRTASCTHAKTPANCPAQCQAARGPRPSPSLHSTSPVACAVQAHSLPYSADCANVNPCRRRRASRYSAHWRRRCRTVSTTRSGLLSRRRSDRSGCLHDVFPLSPMPQFKPAPPV